MKKVGTLQIKILADGKSNESQGDVYSFTTADALKRAGIAYLASLALLVICIPIPGVHFIAVPALLIMGPMFAGLIFKVFFNQEELRIVDPKCPQCSTPLQLSSTPNMWPLRDRCSECKVSYQAEITSRSQTTGAE